MTGLTKFSLFCLASCLACSRGAPDPAAETSTGTTTESGTPETEESETGDAESESEETENLETESDGEADAGTDETASDLVPSVDVCASLVTQAGCESVPPIYPEGEEGRCGWFRGLTLDAEATDCRGAEREFCMYIEGELGGCVGFDCGDFELSLWTQITADGVEVAQVFANCNQDPPEPWTQCSSDGPFASACACGCGLL